MSNTIKDKIIMGIDPGTNIMGFGIIKVVNNTMEILELNELNISKEKDHYLKLSIIFKRTSELIQEYAPDEIAIEAPFFGKNVQSMLKLGRAQGVAMAAGLNLKIPITEYSPKKIKLSMNIFRISNKKFLSFAGCIIVLTIFNFDILHAEILSRSRPEPEIRERIHKILSKSLREDYIDVSVILHSVLDNEPIKKDTDLLPGVKIKTEEKDVQALFSYRIINLTVNKSVNLNQVEMRIRSEISELNSQDRFEQSIVLDKLQIERPDFSEKLVEYVNLLVAARADLNGDEPVNAQEKLKQAAEISASFPAGYEMLGVDQLLSLIHI